MRSFVLLLAVVLGVAQSASAPPRMTLMSPAFGDGQDMPVRLTCDGEDRSPPLNWSGVPPGTRSLALICEDRDAPAGRWVHWLIYDVPPGTDHFSEGMPRSPEFAEGARQGLNSWNDVGYRGPCPQEGARHHYVFTLYASDIAPDLEAGASASTIRAALAGHVLAKATLVGMYERAYR